MTDVDTFKDAFRGATVLVTGDTGFKGSWLALWLHLLGAKVFGFALPPRSEQENFSECQLLNLISHIDGDVRNFDELRTVFDRTRPDYAFHLAAQPLVLASYRNPMETFSTNVMGTAHFLECVRHTPSLKSSIVVTSDKCYRNDGTGRLFTEQNALGGKDPYSASKACAELITESYCASFASSMGGSLASARAGNVIGGGDWCEDRLVPDVFRSLRADTPVEIRNPNAIRPWQHVLEACSGYLLLAARLGRNSDLEGAWNFGPTEENCVSVSDLVGGLLNRLGVGSYFVSADSSNREAAVLKLDASKARTFLGWRPVLNFERTVEFTVRGYRTGKTETLRARIEQIQEYVNLLRLEHPSWGETPATL
jgi:CDP-glucose 4,6-dehydratase